MSRFVSRRHRNSRQGTSFSNNDDAGASARPEGRERHPSHLKGREIGLFYAKRNKERRDKSLGPLQVGLRLNNDDPATTKIKKLLRADKLLNEYTSTTDKKDYTHVEDSRFKRAFLQTINQTIGDKVAGCLFGLKRNPELDLAYKREFESKITERKYEEMQNFRSQLPSFTMRDEILKLINDNQISVISGETGCGKTTQVAQFILDDMIKNEMGSVCNIVCSQPRRISAISVAERVAQERAEKLGKSVGYHIRLEHVLPRETASITFCTTGIILKKMETDPGLSGASHLILDEIHERDVLSDFIITLIKDIIRQRKDLKLILMSATLNSEKFSQYFNNAPHLNIPGFTYPVQEYYLEDVLQRTGFVYEDDSKRRKRSKTALDGNDFRDVIDPYLRDLESKGWKSQIIQQLRKPESEKINLDLILALLKDICQKEDEGAILVFVTGFSEISALTQLMEQSGSFPRYRYLIIPLHSIMPSVDQKQVFETPPPGVRKIIIATNIAETSITINDVVFVIDCGKIKISNFDVETNTQTLQPEWVSIANAKQRKGRAGRVRPGICFHLFTRAREMLLEQFQLPEILRKRLEDVILVAKLLQVGKIEVFFNKLIDAPSSSAVDLSIELLKRLNALDEQENLTPLGFHLAKLPMAPQMGKMILFGAIFSCLDPILSIAASLDFKDAFQLPIGKLDEAHRQKQKLANNLKSDHLLFHEVLRLYEESENRRRFCWNNFLSEHTIKLLIDMKRQFAGYLREMNFVPNSDPDCPLVNKNSDNLSLVKAIVGAGLYPNLLRAPYPGKKPLMSAFTAQRHQFHPKSVLAEERFFPSPLLVYYHKIKTKSDFIHDATLVNPLAILFFGDKFDVESQESGAILTTHGTLKFKCSDTVKEIVVDLRARFHLFLEYKISHPGSVNWYEDKLDILCLE